MGGLKKNEKHHSYRPDGRGSCAICQYAKTNQRHDVVVLSRAAWRALVAQAEKENHTP